MIKKMIDNEYFAIDRWSASSMKKILDKGIDYAVAAKRSGIESEPSKALDFGSLVHMLILGGEDKYALSEFKDFRTNAAREWRDARLAEGKTIITQAQFDKASEVLAQAEAHPALAGMLGAQDVQKEVASFGTISGVELKGKADIWLPGDSTVVDIKTTTQFDKFGFQAYYLHYDLQAAVYQKLFKAKRFLFVALEVTAPYRVQVFEVDTSFDLTGSTKLDKCLNEIKQFGDREPNFLIEQMGVLKAPANALDYLGVEDESVLDISF